MDPRRLRIGEWLLGLGGVVLLASTFLDWYDVDSRQSVQDSGSAAVLTARGSLSAWEAFSVVDLLIVLLAALAIGSAVMAAVHATPAASLALASLAALVGLVVLIALAFRALSPPAFSVEGTEIPGDDISLASGLWIGLAACALTVGAAFASMRSERFPRAARIEVPIEKIPPPQGGKA